MVMFLHSNQWGFDDAVETFTFAGKMTEAEQCYRPKIPGNLGAKKDDHGELPIDHPTIDKLSDPIHFIKNYKSELWSLVALSKSKSKTWKADAMRLSRNLAYMMAQHSPSLAKQDATFENFEKAGDASFELHWNNHKHCGLWCQAKSWTSEEKEKNKKNTETRKQMRKSTINNC